MKNGTIEVFQESYIYNSAKFGGYFVSISNLYGCIWVIKLKFSVAHESLTFMSHSRVIVYVKNPLTMESSYKTPFLRHDPLCH